MTASFEEPRGAPDAEQASAPTGYALRRRLGIPSAAAQVLIFGESSHWDPNWLRTTEEYFDGQIVPVIRAIIKELQADPARIFSIESTFFLERFWQRHPEHHDELHGLLNERRLRLTGTGITTPDTVIPDPEAILRDYLLGQQWLRSIGIGHEPKLAYLPDDFGYAPTLPSLLAELGYTQAAITRIDGAYFVGADYRKASDFPLPGSNAYLLQKQKQSADFIWKAPDGREVLCHWNPFTYFQGDMLAYVGIIRWMGRTFGVPWRTRRHIAERVASYVNALTAVARTPYLFCPIGCDFNPPIPNLGALLDRYNREVYPTTGVWVVSAGLDDYMDLIETKRSTLPRLALDFNPYWMGFYAARPEAKVRHRRVTRKIIAAEAEHVADALRGPSPSGEFRALSDRVWQDLALANHHDFITGTSPDRVWNAEQAPLLRDAEDRVDAWLAQRPNLQTPRTGPGIEVVREANRVTVRNAHAELAFDEERGGTLTQWRTADGIEHVDGPSFDMSLYRDTGGLWRLGHEFAGGRFNVIQRGQSRAVSIRTNVGAHHVQLTSRSDFGSRTVERTVWLFDDRPEIVVQVNGSLPEGTSLCLDFETGIIAHTVDMDTPGGVTERPRRKLYDPTFWPAFSYVHVYDETLGVAAFLAGPASVSVNALGRLSLMVQRNATREYAYGILPVLAHPARGTDPGFPVTCVFTPTQGMETSAYKLQAHAQDVLQRIALFGPAELPSLPPDLPFEVSGDAFISALKPADRGPGLIVRLTGRPGADVRLACSDRPIVAAHRADARERDRHALCIADGAVEVPMDGSIVTVRLRLDNDAPTP